MREFGSGWRRGQLEKAVKDGWMFRYKKVRERKKHGFVGRGWDGGGAACVGERCVQSQVSN